MGVCVCVSVPRNGCGMQDLGMGVRMGMSLGIGEGMGFKMSKE